MIKTRQTEFEIDVREVADSNVAFGYAMEMAGPWMDELRKDGLRLSQPRFQVLTDIVPGSPWKAKLVVMVDTQTQE